MLDRYEIRLCEKEEAGQLREFIGKYWKPNHALALSQELLDWQHFDPRTGKYNFVVARHRESGEFHAIYGYIPTSLFDPALEPYRDYWPAVWMVREDVGAPALGMFVYYFVARGLKPRSLSGFGMNPDLVPLARKLSHQMGFLDHFYMVNESMREFELIDLFDGRYVSEGGVTDSNRTLTRCDDDRFMDLEERLAFRPAPNDMPMKSVTFLYNRYVRHPFYDYHVYEIASQGRVEALVVTRLASHAGHHALRIVDYYGKQEALAGLLEPFQALLRSYDAEYADFYHLGFDRDALYRAGFLERTPESKVVVPNYFEPFARRNVELEYVIYTDPSGFDFTFVKGDCDQDRPNVVDVPT